MGYNLGNLSSVAPEPLGALRGASQVQGTRLALFGDSILDQAFFNTASLGYDTPRRKYNRGYINSVNRSLGNIFGTVFNKAVSGNNTQQMQTRWAADIVANATQFDILWLNGGVNDIRNSLSVQTAFDNLKSFIEGAAALGKMVIWQLPLPVGWANTAAQAGMPNTEANARKQYQQLRALCLNYLVNLPAGIKLLPLDFWPLLADVTSANEDFLAKYSKLDGTLGSGDQIHPGWNGSLQMAAYAKAKIEAFLPALKRPTYGPANVFDATHNPKGNMISNPGMFTGTTSPGATVSGTVPTGFTADRPAGTYAAGDVVLSVATFAQGQGLGKKIVITPTIPSGLTGTESVSVRNTAVAPSGKFASGDTVIACCRVKLNNVAALRSIALRLTHLSTPNVEIWDGDAGAVGDYLIDDGVYDIWLETEPLTLTSTGTGLQASVLTTFDCRTVGAAGTIEISEFAIRHA